MQKLTYVEQLTYTFQYTNTVHIEFVVHDCKPDCLCYDSWATVFFKHNQDSNYLACSSLYEKLYDFVYYLEKSLNNKNMLDEHHIPDIGYLFNEMHYKKSVLHETVAFNELYNHVVWSPVIKIDNIQTWLYSNANQEIVLFLAPVYPFFNCKPSAQNVSYEAWLKTYKPVARYVIPKGVAQQWLEQACDIMSFIEKNRSAF